MSKRSYTVLEHVADPPNNTFVGDVDLPFDELDSLQKKTMEPFFQTVQNTMDSKHTLDNGAKNLLYSIFKHAVEAAEQDEGRRGVERFSTTWFFKMVVLSQPGTLNGLQRYRFCLDEYLFRFC